MAERGTRSAPEQIVRRTRPIVLFCAVSAALLATAACDPGAAPNPPVVAQISLGVIGGGAMNVGQTTRLVVVMIDSSNNIINGGAASFASTDTTVATVSQSGIITARGVGVTLLSATAGGVSATQRLSVAPATPAFTRVEVGGSQSCALTGAGAAYCWRNSLGDGVGSSQGTPQLVNSSVAFQSISVGNTHQCALTSGGVAYCWGDNQFGQLGTGDTVSASAPVLVAGGLTFASISAGFRSTCAVTASGAAYCWGSNASGELGDGTTTQQTSPTPVTGGLQFQSVSVGAEFACGITTSGDAYCWGDNSSGQLGTTAPASSPSPLALPGGLTFRSVSAATGYACGLTTLNSAYCWGANAGGNLGIGTHDTNLHAPSVVVGGLSWQTLSAGDTMACGIASTGAAYCWGTNLYDLLANGIATYRSDGPFVAVGGLQFRSISSRGDHACALTANGVLYCWGAYVS